MRPLTCFAATLVGLAAHLGLASSAIAEPPPVCTGSDIVAERLEANDPAMQKAVAAANAIPNDGAVLWKLEKEGQAASYVFGTIHSTDPRVTKLSPALEAAIAAVDTVALELTKGADQDMIGLITADPSTFFFTDGRSLANKLSDERMASLRKAAAGTGMPVDTLKPWMASMLLAVSACERTRMASNIPVLDSVVEARGTALGKTVIALETMETQIAALSGIPMEDQLPQLQLAIDLYERADDFGETLKRLYLQRKIGLVWTMNLAIAEQRGIPEARFKSFEDTLITQRNRDMAETGFKLMETGPTLVAVGALHVVGKTGLIALAKEAGYRVTPIE